MLDFNLIQNTISKTLAPKFEASVLNGTSNISKNNEIINRISEHVFKNYSKSNILTIDFIKGLHKTLYKEGEKILVFRDGIYYHNIPGEWRLHNYKPQILNSYYIENPKYIDKNISKLIESYNLKNSKKKTDLLKLYFDFLAIHPFGDKNGTLISILCDLECVKYGFSAFNILNLRHKDIKYFYYFFENYEKNIDKENILNEAIDLINNFNENNISEEIIKEKNKQTIFSTEIYSSNSNLNLDQNEIYQKIIKQEKNLGNYFLKEGKYNLVREIIWHTFRPYFLQKTKEIQDKFGTHFEKHMDILTDYTIKYYIDSPDNLSINFLKGFHKKIYDGIDNVKIKTTGGEDDYMIPGEFKTKQNGISRLDKPQEYLLGTKPELVKTEISNLLNYINNSDDKIYNKCIKFFLTFTEIHPFPDDNGKIGMIMTDLILIKNNIYPFFMSYYKIRNERKFYEIIQDYSHGINTDFKPFYEMILESYSLLQSGSYVLKEIGY